MRRQSYNAQTDKSSFPPYEPRWTRSHSFGETIDLKVRTLAKKKNSEPLLKDFPVVEKWVDAACSPNSFSSSKLPRCSRVSCRDDKVSWQDTKILPSSLWWFTRHSKESSLLQMPSIVFAAAASKDSNASDDFSRCSIRFCILSLTSSSSANIVLS